MSILRILNYISPINSVVSFKGLLFKRLFILLHISKTIAILDCFSAKRWSHFVVMQRYAAQRHHSQNPSLPLMTRCNAMQCMNAMMRRAKSIMHRAKKTARKVFLTIADRVSTCFFLVLIYSILIMLTIVSKTTSNYFRKPLQSWMANQLISRHIFSQVTWYISKIYL
jgi:hypothetical protein